MTDLLKDTIKTDKKRVIAASLLAVASFSVCAVFFDLTKGVLFAVMFLIAGFLKIKIQVQYKLS